MAEPLIPAEAVRAVSVILRAWEVDSSGEGDIAPVAEFDDEALELVEAALAAIAEQGLVIVDADRLTDGIPKDAPLWPDDEELADGHFTDRTYAWWKVALGHPRAHSGCCATCGCASSCFLDVFYDAVVMSVARHALASGTAPQPPGTLQDVETSRDGTRGHLGLPNGPTGLSALRRAEEAEEALDIARQTIARVTAYALDQATYRPVEADALSAVLLNRDPRDLHPGDALAALTPITEEKPCG